jgi:hemerythrin
MKSKFVEWSDALSVGIEEIDEQHRVLVGLVNRMHQAIHERHGSDVVKGILAELVDYTRIHFAVEESLMRILDYPGYEKHKLVHEELYNHVIQLQTKVESGKTAIGFELMHFLKNWLTKHIMEEDREYSSCFLAAGAKPKLTKKTWIKRLWAS